VRIESLPLFHPIARLFLSPGSAFKVSVSQPYGLGEMESDSPGGYIRRSLSSANVIRDLCDT